MNFRKSSEGGGGGGFFNPKIYIADFCHFRRYFGHEFREKIAIRFSENSSILELLAIPNHHSTQAGLWLAEGTPHRKKRYLSGIAQMTSLTHVLQKQVTMITTMMGVIIVIIILVLLIILVLKMTKKYHII